VVQGEQDEVLINVERVVVGGQDAPRRMEKLKKKAS